MNQLSNSNGMQQQSDSLALKYQQKKKLGYLKRPHNPSNDTFGRTSEDNLVANQQAASNRVKGCSTQGIVQLSDVNTCMCNSKTLLSV